MKILLVGVSARAMAASAVRSGYDVVALDAFGDLDLQALCNGYSLRRDFHQAYSAKGLYQASQKLQFEGVAYTANFENYPKLVEAFSQQKQLLGNPPDVLKRVRNWAKLFEVLNKAGFCTPETWYSLNGRQPDPQRNWLQKPRRGGGGQHVQVWKNGQSIGRGMLLQEQIEGQVCSAQFVANGKEAVVLGLTEQLIGRPEFGAQGFMYCGNILPLPEKSEAAAILDQARQIINLLTREFELVGVNGMDFILSKGEIYPIEINPRFTAAMELVESAYGLPVFDLHIKALTQGELPEFHLEKAKQPTMKYYAKTILYAKKDGRAPNTNVWIRRGYRDVPHPGERLVLGKPICTILASADTPADCLPDLTNQAEAIQGEIND